MDDSPHDHCVLLLSCLRCKRLHEPHSALDLNPICSGCTEKLPTPPDNGLDHRPTGEGGSP
jgi:hypothetical protein